MKMLNREIVTAITLKVLIALILTFGSASCLADDNWMSLAGQVAVCSRPEQFGHK